MLRIVVYLYKSSDTLVYVNNEQDVIRDRDRLWIISDEVLSYKLIKKKFVCIMGSPEVTCIKCKHKFLITIIYIYIFILQNKMESFIKVNA